MKRIGVLTFHRSINTGAFIQCYSLCQKLKKDFPDEEIEIVDYCTKRVLNNYTYHLVPYLFSELNRSSYGSGSRSGLRKIASRSKQLLKNPGILNERRNEWLLFEKDWKQLPLSAEQLASDNVFEFTNWIKNRYDIIIVGSDCVWQYQNYPFPNAYFLHDEIGSKKLSYAGCAYKVNLNEMRDKDIEFMRQSFSSYAYLGVRDIWTEELMHNLNIDVEYSHNCDPAFLLETDNTLTDIDKLRNKLEDLGVDFSKKIIGLQVNYELLGKMVKNAVGSECQVVAIRRRNPYADIYIEDLSPLEWSRVFSLFHVTVTDFFHGTILSIVNGTFPVVIETDYRMREREKTRLNDLINRLGMKEQYFEMHSHLDIDEKRLKECIYRSIESPGKELKSVVNREKKSYDNFKEQLSRMI